MTYIDDPTIAEVFADHVRMMMFNDGNLRIELCVTRFDEPHPPQPPLAHLRTATRLALTPNAALQLHDQMAGLISALEKQGVLHRHQQQQSPPGSQH
jgi:hypothetical protein